MRALAVVVVALLVGPSPAAAAPRMVTCKQASEGAFDPNGRSVRVGPMWLMGARTYGDAGDWIREEGYAKMPLLLRPRRRVTLRISSALRDRVGLYYANDGDGANRFADRDPALTFRACRAGRSRSRLGERKVTFWAGGLLTDGSTLCVPLSIQTENETVRRVRIPLGRAC